MALDHAIEHPSRRAAVTSTAAKIGCTQQTLHDWVKKAEVDSGKRPGVPTELAEKLKALERENRGLAAAESRIETVGGKDVLLVKRFDREKTAKATRGRAWSAA